MKKSLICFCLLLVLLAGCSRAPRYKNAAAHLGDPRTVQVFVPGENPAAITDKAKISRLMSVLNDVEVRKLTVDEEIDLILVQGVTLDATEIRFRDNQGKTYKAMLIADGSLLVVEGAVGDNQDRRDLFISEPGQDALRRELQHLSD
jgi:hypothetical protein